MTDRDFTFVEKLLGIAGLVAITAAVVFFLYLLVTGEWARLGSCEIRCP